MNREVHVRFWERLEVKFLRATRPQFPAQGLLGNGDTELLEYPLRQIDQPPAHHAMNRRDRAALNHLRDRPALGLIELRRLPW